MKICAFLLQKCILFIYFVYIITCFYKKGHKYFVKIIVKNILLV